MIDAFGMRLRQVLFQLLGIRQTTIDVLHKCLILFEFGVLKAFVSPVAGCRALNADLIDLIVIDAHDGTGEVLGLGITVQFSA